MADPSPPPRRRRRGTSIALICIGLLILVPSGLCTAVFGSLFIGDSDLLGLVVLFGGPPILIGLALLLWGLRRDR